MTIEALKDIAVVLNPLLYRLVFMMGVIFVPVVITGTCLKSFDRKEAAHRLNRLASIIAGMVLLMIGLMDVLYLAVNSNMTFAACLVGAVTCGALGLLGIFLGLRRALH